MITCKECKKELGWSKRDAIEICAACYERDQLEKALEQGYVANHDHVDDEKIDEVVKRMKSKNPKAFEGKVFGDRIEKYIKKHKARKDKELKYDH